MAVTRLAQQTGAGHNSDGFDITLDTTSANFVVVLVTRHTGTSTATTATCAGSGMTSAGESPAGDSSAMALLYIVNPTQGASTVIAVRGSDANWRGAAVAIAFSGVDTSAPLDAFPAGNSSAGSTTPTTGTFAAGASDYVLQFFGARNSSPSAPTVSARGSGQANVGFVNNGGSGGVIACVDEGTAGDTDGDWTLSGSVGWGSAGIAINAAAGGAADGEVVETATSRISVASEVVETGSARISLAAEVVETGSARINVAGEVAEATTARLSAQSESLEVASARVGVQGESIETASARIAARGIVIETASARIGIAAELLETASARISLAGEAVEAASARLSISGTIAETASVRIDLQTLSGQVIETSSARILVSGESIESASARISLAGVLTELASARLSVAGEANEPASTRISTASTVVRTISARFSLAGALARPSSARLGVQGDLVRSASVRITTDNEATDAWIARIITGPSVKLEVEGGSAVNISVKFFSKDGIMDAWHPGNTNYIELTPRSTLNRGRVIKGAVATARVRIGGNDVVGMVQPLPIPEVEPGRYFAATPKDIVIVHGDTLDVEIVVDGGADAYLKETTQVPVTNRTS